MAGQIPATIVKRQDGLLASGHQSPGPYPSAGDSRQHIASLNDARDPALLGAMLAFARDLAREAGLSERGYRVVMNTNSHGGQTVFHMHLHVLGGRAMQWPPG